MLADWIIKKEQLCQMGSHPVPGTKREEVVAREEKEEVVIEEGGEFMFEEHETAGCGGCF